MFLFNWARVLTDTEPRPEARSCSGEAYVFLPRVSILTPQTACAVLGTHRIPTHGTNPQLRLLRWYSCLLVRIAPRDKLTRQLSRGHHLRWLPRRRLLIEASRA